MSSSLFFFPPPTVFLFFTLFFLPPPIAEFKEISWLPLGSHVLVKRSIPPPLPPRPQTLRHPPTLYLAPKTHRTSPRDASQRLPKKVARIPRRYQNDFLYPSALFGTPLNPFPFPPRWREPGPPPHPSFICAGRGSPSQFINLNPRSRPTIRTYPPHKREAKGGSQTAPPPPFRGLRAQSASLRLPTFQTVQVTRNIKGKRSFVSLFQFDAKKKPPRVPSFLSNLVGPPYRTFFPCRSGWKTVRTQPLPPPPP